jgi:hypothetical protein
LSVIVVNVSRLAAIAACSFRCANSAKRTAGG